MLYSINSILQDVCSCVIVFHGFYVSTNTCRWLAFHNHNRINTTASLPLKHTIYLLEPYTVFAVVYAYIYRNVSTTKRIDHDRATNSTSPG